MFHGQKAQTEAKIQSNASEPLSRTGGAPNASRMAPLRSLGGGRIAFGIYLLSIVIFILGCSYASVPLYQLYCQASGFGGGAPTVQKDSWKENGTVGAGSITEQRDELQAPITIHFNADLSENLL